MLTITLSLFSLAGFDTCGEVKTYYQGQECCGQDDSKPLNKTDLVDDILKYKSTAQLYDYSDFNNTAELAAFKIYSETLGRLPTTAEVEDIASREIWYDRYQELLMSDEYLEVRGMPTDTDLTGRVFAISGMSGGFGFSTAVLLAQRGAKVYGFSRTELPWLKVVESAQRAQYSHPMPWPTYTGPVGVSSQTIDRMHWSKADVKNRTAVMQFFDHVFESEGRLDGVYITHGTDLRDSDLLEAVPVDLQTEMERHVDRFSIKPSTPKPDLTHDHIWGYWNVMAGADNVMKLTSDSLKTVALTSSIAGLQVIATAPTTYKQVKNVEYNSMSFEIRKMGYSVNTIHPITCATDAAATGLLGLPGPVMDWEDQLSMVDGALQLTPTEGTKDFWRFLAPDAPSLEDTFGIKDWQKLFLYMPQLFENYPGSFPMSLPARPIEKGLREPMSIAQHAAYALADPTVNYHAFIQYYPPSDNGAPEFLHDQLFFLDRDTVGSLTKRVHTALIVGNGAEFEASGLEKEATYTFF